MGIFSFRDRSGQAAAPAQLDPALGALKERLAEAGRHPLKRVPSADLP